MIQLLQYVETGQIIIGDSDLPSALMHSMAVTRVRFTPVLPFPRKSSLPISTLTEPSMLSMTPVSSMLHTFSGRMAGSCSTLPMTSNHAVTLSYMRISCRFQSIDCTLLALISGWRFSKARGQFLLGGLVSLLVEGRRQVIRKASTGIHLMRTGCPKLNMSSKNETRAFSSSILRHCWPWAFPSIEELPCSRWHNVVRKTSSICTGCPCCRHVCGSPYRHFAG